MSRTRRAAFLLAAVGSAVAEDALAQPFDHVMCHRVENAKTFATAEVDLTASFDDVTFVP
jgi:hypothetical protein